MCTYSSKQNKTKQNKTKQNKTKQNKKEIPDLNVVYVKIATEKISETVWTKRKRRETQIPTQYKCILFQSIRLDQTQFDSIRFDFIRFHSISFDFIRFHSISFDSTKQLQCTYGNSNTIVNITCTQNTTNMPTLKE